MDHHPRRRPTLRPTSRCDYQEHRDLTNDDVAPEPGTPEATNPDPVTRAIAISNTAPETKTFSVEPSSTYWILVGAKVGSPLPLAYSASLCGATFTP